jgi:hypothetical protein
MAKSPDELMNEIIELTERRVQIRTSIGYFMRLYDRSLDGSEDKKRATTMMNKLGDRAMAIEKELDRLTDDLISDPS